MNCGYTQIRLWSKDKAQIEKAVAEANAAVNAVMESHGHQPTDDHYGINFLEARKGKNWNHTDQQWVMNGRSVFVAETRLCERYDFLAMVEDKLNQAAKANGLVQASFNANPDELQEIDVLFDTWIETASFKFADDDEHWALASWIQGLDEFVPA